MNEWGWDLHTQTAALDSLKEGMYWNHWQLLVALLRHARTKISETRVKQYGSVETRMQHER